MLLYSVLCSHRAGAYSSIITCPRYIHVVILLAANKTTTTDCNHDAQGYVEIKYRRHFWSGRSLSTEVQAAKHTGQRGSAWESNPSIPLAVLCVCIVHIGHQWNTLSVHGIAMLSHIGMLCSTLSVHDVLMLCHIREPPPRRRWRDKS